MRKRERVVVVGGGVAGLRTAERLRELGFNDEIVIVGAESGKPYHRPPLSKQLLCGKLRPSDLVLPSYTELDATWRLGTPVLGMDARRQVVVLQGGEEIRYDGLVIATGVEPRHLPGVPIQDPRVHYLYTVDDSLALRANLQRTRRPLVVMGAGFIGCELASTAHHLGREVTIVGRSKVLLGKAVGPQLAERITALHQGNGVQLALGEKVLHWHPQDQGVVMNLSSGKVIVAGAVVVCAGSVPSVNWLRGSGLTVDDGVVCEPTCHVLGRGDVVAAGDVAKWPNLRFSNKPRRVEHWLNAIEMGRHAAESLLAGRAAAKPFTPIPRFWSEQHGMRIQGAGIPALGEDTVQLLPSGRGDQSVTGFVADGRLVGLVALNSPQALLSWQAELDRQTAPRLHGPEREQAGQEPVTRDSVARDSVEVLAPEPARRPGPPPGPTRSVDHPSGPLPRPNRSVDHPSVPVPTRSVDHPSGPLPVPGRVVEPVPSRVRAAEPAARTPGPVPVAGLARRIRAESPSQPQPRPGPRAAHTPAPYPAPVATDYGGLHAATELGGPPLRSASPRGNPRRGPDLDAATEQVGWERLVPGPVTPPPFPVPLRAAPQPPTREWEELRAPTNGISRQGRRRRA